MIAKANIKSTSVKLPNFEDKDLIFSLIIWLMSPKYESQKTQRKGVRRWDLLVDTQTGAIPLESICQYQAKLRRHTD
jgi:hypothetical protein